LDAPIVNEADDLVICCKPGKAGAALRALRDRMSRPKLTVQEKKTRRCSVREEPFTLLGFTLGLRTAWQTGRAYVAPSPSAKKVRGICTRIRAETSGRTLWRDEEEQGGRLNRLLLGWANYFRLGYVRSAWRVV